MTHLYCIARVFQYNRDKIELIEHNGNKYDSFFDAIKFNLKDYHVDKIEFEESQELEDDIVTHYYTAFVFENK